MNMYATPYSNPSIVLNSNRNFSVLLSILLRHYDLCHTNGDTNGDNDPMIFRKWANHSKMDLSMSKAQH